MKIVKKTENFWKIVKNENFWKIVKK